MDTNTNQIRVLLIDDNTMIQRDMAEFLHAVADIELVAQGYNGKEAIELCEQHQPDIVLMDISMPIMNGLEATRSLAPRFPDTKIIALTGVGDTKVVREMISAGAIGYVLKEVNPEELVNTIRAVHGGKSVFSSEVLPSLLNPSLQTVNARRDYRLTTREIEILRNMVDGKTNPEIAETLLISLATVKFHISHIFEKLDVNSRSAAISLAVKQRLV